MYGHRSLRRIRRPVALFALVALLVAQMAAGSHAARHLRVDNPDVPGTHTQVCLECASFAPLASAVGGAVVALTVAALGLAEIFVGAGQLRVVQRQLVAFRSRASPR